MNAQPKTWLGIFMLVALWVGWKYLDYLDKTAVDPFDLRFSANGTIVIPSSPELSQQAIQEVNQIRAKYGRRPLIWSDRAYRLALARAEDMAKYDYYRKNAVKPCTLGQGCKAQTVLSFQNCDKISLC